MQRSGVRDASAGEASIAYETVGDGPVDIVLAPGFVSHLDLQWEIPSHRESMRGVSGRTSGSLRDTKALRETRYKAPSIAGATSLPWLSSRRWPSGSLKKQRVSPHSAWLTDGVRNSAPRSVRTRYASQQSGTLIVSS